MKLRVVLEEMIAKRGSDLHIFVGFPPVARINGSLVPMDHEIVTPQEMVALAEQILTPKQLQRFAVEKEIDFGFGVPGLGRFRANISYRRPCMPSGVSGAPSRWRRPSAGFSRTRRIGSRARL